MIQTRLLAPDIASYHQQAALARAHACYSAALQVDEFFLPSVINLANVVAVLLRREVTLSMALVVVVMVVATTMTARSRTAVQGTVAARRRCWP